MVDFDLQQKGETLLEALERKKSWAEGKVYVDYSLHPAVMDPRPDVIEEVKKACQEYGTPSFKIFMVYDFRVDDATMIQLLEETKKYGGLVQVHAENVHIIDHMNQVLEKEGKLEPWYHAVSRPNIAEEEAIARAAKMVELTGSRIYIVHLSSMEGLVKVQEARDRGVNVFAETCPQYLLLDEERKVQQARLHIVEFRGFERFIQGRPYWEMPVAVQRLSRASIADHRIIEPAAVTEVLARLQTEGRVAPGAYRPGGTGQEWDDTEVLRRLRRRSLAALRKGVEAVDGATLGRFLPAWHGVGAVEKAVRRPRRRSLRVRYRRRVLRGDRRRRCCRRRLGRGAGGRGAYCGRRRRARSMPMSAGSLPPVASGCSPSLPTTSLSPTLLKIRS